MNTQSSGTITSKDGTTIAFDKVGSGAAVLLVDGAMSYRGYHGSKPLADALAHAFTVYVYDRRGRGASGDTQPYAVEREIEDIDALITEAGGSAFLYGTSSGAALALRAAAALGVSKVPKLALYEPPYDDDTQAFAEYSQQTNALLQANRRGDAVTLFLQDMLPPEMLDDLRQTPEWALMEAVAPTLAYDNLVLGDGAVPQALAQSLKMPVLVLDGAETMDFMRANADTLAHAIPNAQHQTLAAQDHSASAEAVAPALTEFFSA